MTTTEPAITTADVDRQVAEDLDAEREVWAIGRWNDNAEMIADVARLGYLDGRVLDCTYGAGRFWRLWQPEILVATDLNPAKSPSVPDGVDFTAMPFPDRDFDAVVFDPPYRLNGTPDQDFDEGYGIDAYTSWQERMALILAGTAEAARVADRDLLVKCQAQVVSGAVRWQDDEVTAVAVDAGFRKIDRFDLHYSPRKQPKGRRQAHARRNHSTLLVFRRTRRARRG